VIWITEEQLKLCDPRLAELAARQMEQRMNTTELNTSNDIRILSDEDLGAVAGGFQVYTGGGGGRVVSHGPSGADLVGVFGVLTLIAIGLSL
jgi:hypothetical protein